MGRDNGYNARNDEIRDNVERMRGEREAYADALVIVQFNTRLSTSVVLADDCCTAYVKTSLVVIACDSCGTVVDLDTHQFEKRRVKEHLPP